MCNDGNACTSGDQCNAGICGGTPSCGDAGPPNSGIDASFPDGGSGFPDGGSGFSDGGTGFPDGGSGFPDGGSGFPDLGITDFGTPTGLDGGAIMDTDLGCLALPWDMGGCSVTMID